MSQSRISSHYYADRAFGFELIKVRIARLEQNRSNGRKRYHAARERDRAEQMAQISTLSPALNLTPSGSMASSERDIENINSSVLPDIASTSYSSNYNSYAAILNVDTTEAHTDAKIKTSQADVHIPFGAFVPVPPPSADLDLPPVSKIKRYICLIVTDGIKPQCLDSDKTTRDRPATRHGRSQVLV